MRRRDREKIIQQTMDVQSEAVGAAVYFRPLEADEKKLVEIAKFSGEKKSAVVQKLIHLALAGKEISFSESRVEEKIDWLIQNARQQNVLKSDLSQQLKVANNRTERIENQLDRLAKIVAEIYCMLNVAVSYLNQIFAKMLEFISPVEVEREFSVEVANRNTIVLIEHSAADLEKCLVFHGTDSNELFGKRPYLLSKIAELRERSEFRDKDQQ